VDRVACMKMVMMMMMYILAVARMKNIWPPFVSMMRWYILTPQVMVNFAVLG
jgi:hypothetical protein